MNNEETGTVTAGDGPSTATCPVMSAPSHDLWSARYGHHGQS